MLNTKLNLYNAEWLDLVFDQRNKSYGAYDLRNHYAGNMVRAMVITFAVIGAGGLYMRLHTKPIEPVEHVTEVIVPDLKKPPLIKAEQKKPDVVKPEKVKAHPQAPTQKFIQMVPTDKPVTEEPPKNSQLTQNIGTENKKGDPGAPIDIPEEAKPGPATAGPPAEDIINPGLLEVQPEPYGGMGAFSKFLSKNLRFPAAASDAGIAGRVVVSFVIERDGSLTNIVVEKGAGYGMDQEAVRVLKMAKAWKPGIQNGRPVRVRYMVPINFQIPE